MRRTLLVLTALLALRATSAFAYYGWVSGRVLYYDARTSIATIGDGPFTGDQWLSYRGLPSVKIYVLLNGTSTVIGTAATDSNGYFSAYWSSSVPNPYVVMNFNYESSYVDSWGTPRFRIATESGGKWVSWTNPITASNYVSSSFGDLYYGSSTNPNKFCNLFATATDFWRQVGSTSTNLNNRLSGVQVRFPVTALSLAIGARVASRSEISMTDSWVVMNNNVLAHEFGHVVQLIQLERDNLGEDCSWGGNGHDWDSVEWQGCASVEGFADFVAAATYYYPSAYFPKSYGHDIQNGCSGSAQWSQSNVARYFWDIYDSRQEGSDNVTMPFAWIVDKMNIFPAGWLNRQDLELWANKNGTNAWDFYYHALYSGNGANVDTANLVSMNCLWDSEW